MADEKKIYIKLAPGSDDGGFYDPATKLDLSRGNVAELGEIGALTAQLLRLGKLVKCDAAGKPLKGE